MTDDKLSQQKLESYLWGCAEYLRNKIDADVDATAFRISIGKAF